MTSQPTSQSAPDEAAARVAEVGDFLSGLRDQFPRVTTDADSWWLASELLNSTEILTLFGEALAAKHPDVLQAIADSLDSDDRD